MKLVKADTADFDRVKAAYIDISENALSDKCWKYVESTAHKLDENGFEEFDRSFPQMEKSYKYTQELFYIYSRSNVLR